MELYVALVCVTRIAVVDSRFGSCGQAALCTDQATGLAHPTRGSAQSDFSTIFFGGESQNFGIIAGVQFGPEPWKVSRSLIALQGGRRSFRFAQRQTQPRPERNLVHAARGLPCSTPPICSNQTY
jgi:hypothetical protein